MDCAAEPHFVECLFVAFYDGSHLVVAERVEFVVGDAGGLALVFVEAHGDVAVGERLHLQRVGRVVHKHFGVYSDIDHVDRVLFYILVVAADFVVPSDCGGSGAERFHKFACPHFGIKPGAERWRVRDRHERRAYRNAVERQCSGERRDTTATPRVAPIAEVSATPIIMPIRARRNLFIRLLLCDVVG